MNGFPPGEGGSRRLWKEFGGETLLAKTRRAGRDQKLYYISEFQAYVINDVGSDHVIICLRVGFSSLFTVEFFAT